MADGSGDPGANDWGFCSGLCYWGYQVRLFPLNVYTCIAWRPGFRGYWRHLGWPSGGAVLGPMMPIDTVTGEMQLTINWLYRMGFFVLIGAFAGVASDGIRQYIRHLYWVSRHDEHSGLPNHRALNDVLAKPHNEPTVLALVLVSVENISELKVAFGPQVAHTVIR